MCWHWKYIKQQFVWKRSIQRNIYTHIHGSTRNKTYGRNHKRRARLLYRRRWQVRNATLLYPRSQECPDDPDPFTWCPPYRAVPFKRSSPRYIHSGYAKSSATGAPALHVPPTTIYEPGPPNRDQQLFSQPSNLRIKVILNLLVDGSLLGPKVWCKALFSKTNRLFCPPTVRFHVSQLQVTVSHICWAYATILANFDLWSLQLFLTPSKIDAPAIHRDLRCYAESSS